jgi:cysteine-rich repeat protein
LCPSLALAVLLGGVGWVAPPGALAVDATGVFAVSGIPSWFDTVSLRQEGSSLSLCAESGGFIGKLMEGSIDSATGAFGLGLARQIFGGGFAVCSLTLIGGFAPDGATFSATFEQYTTCVPPPFTCVPQCLLTASGPVTGTRTSTTPAPCCGDGEPNAGEQCDDGNTSDADCCSGVCHFVPAGIQCPADDDLCTLDRCDGAGSCTHTTIPLCTTTTNVTTTTTTTSTTMARTTTTTLPPGCAPAPLSGCRLPAEPGKAKLQLRDRSPDTGDRVTWKWTKGAATSLGDLGDPLATTDYVFCLYEVGPNLVTSLRAPAAGTCGAKPCWKADSTRGFTYRDREGTPDGVAKLGLAAGAAGKAKMALTAKGDSVPLPSLGALDLPLRAQLQGNGQCWEAAFSVDQASAPEVFKATSD